MNELKNIEEVAEYLVDELLEGATITQVKELVISTKENNTFWQMVDNTLINTGVDETDDLKIFSESIYSLTLAKLTRIELMYEKENDKRKKTRII